MMMMMITMSLHLAMSEIILFPYYSRLFLYFFKKEINFTRKNSDFARKNPDLPVSGSTPFKSGFEAGFAHFPPT